MGGRAGGGASGGMGKGSRGGASNTSANIFGVPKGTAKNYSVTVNSKSSGLPKYGLIWNSTAEGGKATHSHYFTNKYSDLNKYIKQNLTKNGYQLGRVW